MSSWIPKSKTPSFAKSLTYLISLTFLFINLLYDLQFCRLIPIATMNRNGNYTLLMVCLLHPNSQWKLSAKIYCLRHKTNHQLPKKFSVEFLFVFSQSVHEIYFRSSKISSLFNKLFLLSWITLFLALTLSLFLLPTFPLISWIFL